MGRTVSREIHFLSRMPVLRVNGPRRSDGIGIALGDSIREIKINSAGLFAVLSKPTTRIRCDAPGRYFELKIVGPLFYACRVRLTFAVQLQLISRHNRDFARQRYWLANQILA